MDRYFREGLPVHEFVTSLQCGGLTRRGAARHKRPMLHDPRPQPPTARALDRSGILFVAAALLLLVLIAAASVWQASRNADALALAQSTRAQRNIVAAILMAAAEDAETAQRGFLLTSDPDYLQPLVDGGRAMPDLFARLAPYRPQDSQVTDLRHMVGAKLAELDRTVAWPAPATWRAHCPDRADQCRPHQHARHPRRDQPDRGEPGRRPGGGGGGGHPRRPAPGRHRPCRAGDGARPGSA